MRRLKHDQRGATLIELLVGLAIGVMVLFAVTDLEISSWRLQVLDDDRFVKQSQASLVADRIASDVREATAVILVDGSAEIQLSQPAGTITYSFDASRGEVIRRSPSGSQLAGREILALAFARENDGKTVRAEITCRLRDGAQYRLISRAVPRT